MKYCAAIIALCLALAFAACGGENSSPDPGQSDTTGAKSKPEEVELTEPIVQVPRGPPPKKLIVKDIRRGSGPALEDPSDELVVKYVGAYYDTGNVFYSSWNTGGTSKFLLEEVHRGWELGLKGMKAGGRRELIEPSRLAYGAGAAIYVIDLLAVR